MGKSPKLFNYVPGAARINQVKHELLEQDKVLNEVQGQISRAQARMK